ncbi:MAG: MarR family winged helix-turn-helix transcriptional regulator [Qingshengfaniella sp.]
MAARGTDTDQTPDSADAPEAEGYVLDKQVGFLLRNAYQRHQMIFAEQMTVGLTAMQFSMLFRLIQRQDPISQNALGRLVAMDAATTKGVVSRLQAQGLITTARDPDDKRRYMLRSTQKGRDLLARALPMAIGISEATLAPLTRREKDTLLRLLTKIC